jgi:hypothetical protein
MLDREEESWPYMRRSPPEGSFGVFPRMFTAEKKGAALRALRAQ